MRLLPIIALLSLASPAAAGLCDDPAPWPGGPEAAVEFAGLMALAPGRAGDGPNAPEAVSLTGDVLGLGSARRVGRRRAQGDRGRLRAGAAGVARARAPQHRHDGRRRAAAS